MFKDMKLALKIGGGFSIVLILTLIIAVLTITAMSSIQTTSLDNDLTYVIVQDMQNGTIGAKNYALTQDDKYHTEVNNAMDKIVAAATAMRDKRTDKTEIEALNSIINGASSYKARFQEFVGKQTEKAAVRDRMIAYSAQMETNLLALREQAGVAAAGGLGDVNTMLLSMYRVREAFLRYALGGETAAKDSIQTDMDTLASLLRRLRTRVQGSAGAQVDAALSAVTAYTEGMKSYAAIQLVLDESQKQNMEAGAQTIKAATAISDSVAVVLKALLSLTRTTVLVSAVLAIVLGLGLSILITRAITGAMRKGVDFARQIADGDLTARLEIHQKDEIGQLAEAMQNMLERLTGIVEEVNSAAQQVSIGSQQLSSTSQQMSQGATEQASSVEEISSSMEEMTSNIKQNADNALQTEKIAQKSALSAEEGGRAVSATVDAMKNIASKIGIIEEIARSTNMLALNASIEAARAGEYGKGFAVVASEVGKLAERSQKEAGEISKLSLESVSIAEQAGSTIAAMIPDIKRTAELVQEISAASNEQNSGAEQINAAILQLDQVVQQNASAAEESASMAEELASQSEQMQATMGFFRLHDSGQAVRPAPAAHKAAPVIAHAGTRAGRQAAAQKAVPEAQKDPSSPKEPKDVPRLPLGGISLVLDEEAKGAEKDSLDGEYREF